MSNDDWPYDWVYIGDARRGDERLVRELTTVETVEITGRGTLHIVQVGNELPKVGDGVLLDGDVRRVTGVDAHITNPRRPTRDGFAGIIVT